MAAVAFANAAREAHKRQVQSLYRRLLKNSLDWHIDRTIWREEAGLIRSYFEANKNLQNPREISMFLHNTEALWSEMRHPDPVIPPTAPGGTKWERNIPPPTEPIWDHEAHDEDGETLDSMFKELEKATPEDLQHSFAVLETIVNKLDAEVVEPLKKESDGVETAAAYLASKKGGEFDRAFH